MYTVLSMFMHATSMVIAAGCNLYYIVSYRMQYTIVDDVRISMSDGIDLACTVYTPTEATTPIHTILIRTPYNRHLLMILGCIFAQVGYRVVCQDTRGRWASGGTYASSFLSSEKTDGYETITWIQEQFPLSKIGLVGVSYVGYVQWATVAGVLEKDGSVGSIACMVPICCSSDLLSGCYTGGNVLGIDFIARWIMVTFCTGRVCKAGIKNFFCTLHWMYKALVQRSLFTSESVVPRSHRELVYDLLLPSGGDTMDNTDFAAIPIERMGPDDSYWRECSHRDVLPHAPSTHVVTGWYDIFLEGSVLDYRGMVLSDTPNQIRLTIGPWHHLQTIHPGVVGRILRITLRQLREQMPPCRPTTTALDTLSDRRLPVQVFLERSIRTRWGASIDTIVNDWKSCVGATVPSTEEVFGFGQWLGLERWPPTATQMKRLWMCLDQRMDEEGSVSCLARRPAGEVSYTFDSDHPMPSRGVDSFHIFRSGPYRISAAIHARNDAVHFTSDPLVHGVTLAGHASVELFCTFRGTESVDYIVRLCEVFPDGTAVVFAEGVTRVCGCPTNGEVVHVDIGSIGRILIPGQCLRVYIGCSAFPRWEVNDGHPGETGPSCVSEHLIRCAPNCLDGSYLCLPVYPM
jgi:hypothetical protein